LIQFSRENERFFTLEQVFYQELGKIDKENKKI